MYQTISLRTAFLLRIVVYTVLMVLLNFYVASAQQPSKEYEIKSVFVFNFSRFVNWPEESFSTPQSPFVIGILGEDPFGSYLDETVAGEKVNDHPVVVQRYKTIEDVEHCHILFISSDEEEDLKKILLNLKDRSMLTVSDARNFTVLGGMVAFYTLNNKIRFQINMNAVKTTDLVISSKLLRLADIKN